MSHTPDSYFIPSRPEILIQLNKLISDQDIDVDQICKVLKQDIALFSSVLATVNTPYFGLARKITSLEHAVTLLGINRVFTIVRLAALRNSLSTLGPLERFWDTGADVAQICGILARRFPEVNADDAYTLGMLHDCGLPLMMHNFQGYKKFLEHIPCDSISGLHKAQLDQYGVSHYDLGYALTKSWNLPDATCEAIRLQPDYKDFVRISRDNRDEVRTQLCILLLAKEISRKYRTYWRVNKQDIPLVSDMEPILNFMGICDYDFFDFRDDILMMLET